MAASFKEWLTETMVGLQADLGAHRDALEKARREFGTKRAKVIFPILKGCEADLKAAGIFAEAKNENGDSASLSIGSAILIFRLVELRVICTGAPIDEEEFDLSALDEARVDEKVRQFVEPVLRAQMGEKPARGIMVPGPHGRYRP
jgi:hypothetical protein